MESLDVDELIDVDEDEETEEILEGREEDEETDDDRLDDRDDELEDLEEETLLERDELFGADENELIPRRAKKASQSKATSLLAVTPSTEVVRKLCTEAACALGKPTSTMTKKPVMYEKRVVLCIKKLGKGITHM